MGYPMVSIMGIRVVYVDHGIIKEGGSKKKEGKRS